MLRTLVQFASSQREDDCRPSAGAGGPEAAGPGVAGQEAAGPEVSGPGVAETEVAEAAKAARAAGAAGLEVISAQFCLTALQLVYRFLL